MLVSSGAIAAGLAPLGLARRPRDLATQQAAASVGQGLLVAPLHRGVRPRTASPSGQVLLTATTSTRRAPLPQRAPHPRPAARARRRPGRQRERHRRHPRDPVRRQRPARRARRAPRPRRRARAALRRRRPLRRAARREPASRRVPRGPRRRRPRRRRARPVRARPGVGTRRHGRPRSRPPRIADRRRASPPCSPSAALRRRGAGRRGRRHAVRPDRRPRRATRLLWLAHADRRRGPAGARRRRGRARSSTAGPRCCRPGSPGSRELRGRRPGRAGRRRRRAWWRAGLVNYDVGRAAAAARPLDPRARPRARPRRTSARSSTATTSSCSDPLQLSDVACALPHVTSDNVRRPPEPAADRRSRASQWRR